MQIRERCKSGELKRELQNQTMSEHKSMRRFSKYPFAASAFPAPVILSQKVKIGTFYISKPDRICRHHLFNARLFNDSVVKIFHLR